MFFFSPSHKSKLIHLIAVSEVNLRLNDTAFICPLICISLKLVNTLHGHYPGDCHKQPYIPQI